MINVEVPTPHRRCFCGYLFLFCIFCVDLRRISSAVSAGNVFLLMVHAEIAKGDAEPAEH